MDTRTMDGEPAGAGRRAERWRPVPWEVISLMLTVVMVGAVVCGLILAAVGELRGDIRALQTRVASLERGHAKQEGLMEGLRQAFLMHSHDRE